MFLGDIDDLSDIRTCVNEGLATKHVVDVSTNGSHVVAMWPVVRCLLGALGAGAALDTETRRTYWNQNG